MTSRVRNAGVAVAGAALLATGAYALGSQAGDGSASASGQAAAQRGVAMGYGSGPGRPGFERHELGLEALAQRLGVTTDALRTALAGLRQDLPSRDDMAAKLADALGVPVDKVTSVLGRFKPGPGARRSDFEAALAKALGLQTAKVHDALDKMRSQFRPGRGAGRADFEAALADQLGVPTAKLESALRSLR